jgi:hypothetical protein
MMGERKVQQDALFYEFSLERHVPEKHLLRAIDRFVELDGLRWELEPFYSAIAHVGEIGQAQPTRRVLLPEDDVALGPVERSPAADTSLQRPADTDADLGTSDLVKNGHRSQAWGALQQRHHLAVPNRRQWIGPSTATRRSLLRRQSRILFDAIRGGGAEPGRGNGRRLGLAEIHI